MNKSHPFIHFLTLELPRRVFQGLEDPPFIQKLDSKKHFRKPNYDKDIGISGQFFILLKNSIFRTFIHLQMIFTILFSLRLVVNLDVRMHKCETKISKNIQFLWEYFLHQFFIPKFVFFYTNLCTPKFLLFFHQILKFRKRD